MIVFDTSGLLHLLDPNVPAETDPTTGNPVTDAQKRIEYFVSELHDRGEKILIPTPVLAELLILAGPEGPAIFAKLSKSAVFQIEPFDERAAIELSIMTAAALKSKDKKSGSTASMAKVKFDRQIVASARVNRAHTIFSSDVNISKFAIAHGLKVIALWDLPLPPQAAQTTIWEHLKNEP
jgi:hypothetical protein